MFNKFKKKVEDLSKYKTWVPPGHYYSPIPDKQEIQKRKDQLFAVHRQLKGVDLNIDRQHQFLQSALPYYTQLPFKDLQEGNDRYYFQNNFFSYGDGISLYSMMRVLQPKKIIEVGSGFSSALMMDVNDRFFGGDIDLTFIEPYPERLHSLCRKQDDIQLFQTGVQDTDTAIFESLGENDILFIDSSHVSKAGSDVNHLFFEVIPSLASGVYVHVHDIAANFQYPLKWIMEGRSWNESYLLRAFLMYNSAFKIQLFNAYMGSFHQQWLHQNMPLFLKNAGGSIWMKKI